MPWDNRSFQEILRIGQIQPIMELAKLAIDESCCYPLMVEKG
jgi:hypothetical protein